jgi:aryl sulfotransferase
MGDNDDNEGYLMKSYNTAVYTTDRWQGFKHRAGDIFICTPAKCGTTWTQTIVTNLIFPNGDFPAPVMELSPWIEMKMRPADEMHAALEAQTHRRVMKSHTPADGIPWFDDARYVFVCRDGRDAFMSMVNHMDRMIFTDALNEQAIKDGIPPMPNFEGDVHAFFEHWLGSSDEQFFKLANSYWERKDQSNLLLVHFNDLKKDLGGQMRRIAGFLDIEIPQAIWPDVISRCMFENMRENEAMVGDMSFGFKGGTKGFLFKGSNGRWRDVLSAEELKRYDEHLNASMPAAAAQWVTEGGHPTRSS